jgi:hypothetical protein
MTDRPLRTLHATTASATWRAWVIGWTGMLALALVNGTLRATVVQPLLGETIARAAATVLLLLALAVYVTWMQRRWPIPTTGQAWAVGAAWVALTLAFEFGWGRLVEGLAWTTMLTDYDITAGRIWVLVPVGIAVAPALARRRAGRKSRDTGRSAFERDAARPASAPAGRSARRGGPCATNR